MTKVFVKQPLASQVSAKDFATYWSHSKNSPRKLLTSDPPEGRRRHPSSSSRGIRRCGCTSWSSAPAGLGCRWNSQMLYGACYMGPSMMLTRCYIDSLQERNLSSVGMKTLIIDKSLFGKWEYEYISFNKMRVLLAQWISIESSKLKQQFQMVQLN